MVRIIMGLKGSGKTKRLVELVHTAVKEESGNVVCIEKDRKLTYDIPYQARLIHASEYGICTNAMLKGFIIGLHAGNYDITHVFIDNFYKMLDNTSDEAVSAFLAWLDAFSEQENVKFTISAGVDPSTVSEDIRKFVI